MTDQTKKQKIFILGAVTVVVTAITATQFIFSIRANNDINNHHDPCLPASSTTTPSSISVAEIISALAFSLNTLPATINRLHIGIKDLVIGGQGSSREEYYFFRHLKKIAGQQLRIVVPDLDVKAKLTQKLDDVGFSSYEIRAVNGVLDAWQSMVPYDLTNKQKKALKDRLVVLTDGWDIGFGGVMLIPLSVTTVLSMLYSFYAYGEISRVMQYASYGLVPILS